MLLGTIKEMTENPPTICHENMVYQKCKHRPDKYSGIDAPCKSKMPHGKIAESCNSVIDSEENQIPHSKTKKTLAAIQWKLIIASLCQVHETAFHHLLSLGFWSFAIAMLLAHLSHSQIDHHHGHPSSRQTSLAAHPSSLPLAVAIHSSSDPLPESLPPTLPL